MSMEYKAVLRRGYKISCDMAEIMYDDPIAADYVCESNAWTAQSEFLLGFPLYELEDSHYYYIEDFNPENYQDYQKDEVMIALIAKKYGITEPMKTYIALEVY